jgi:segregation and condensation protein B
MSSTNGHSNNPFSDDDGPDKGLMQVAEAVIFAADSPVSPGRIADIMAEVTGQTAPREDAVREVVEQLNSTYAEAGRAFEIHEWGGGYRMATRTELSPFVKALFGQEQEKSLSRSLMETLAILAYRQPVTRPEVDFIRGVNSDYAIRKLLELGLADVKGRSDSLGRPLLYGTTTRFLEQFGLSNLDDLPTLREIEELLDEPHFDEERAQLLALKGDGASINGEEPPEITPNGSEAPGDSEDS